MSVSVIAGGAFPLNGATENEPVAVTGNNSGPVLSDDPFANLASLRLAQDFSGGLGLVKPLLRVPVRKPGKEVFVRVHPGKDYQFPTYVIELKEDSETYLVAPPLWPELAGESTFGSRLLLTAMSRPGNIVFLWPIRMAAADGRLDEWSRSALEIATTCATGSWVRVVSNRALGAYEAHIAPASASWGEPQWPVEKMEDLMRRAFKDRFIQSLDHPVLKRLRGEA